MARLTHSQRDAVRLLLAEGVPPTEIAARLGIGRAQVAAVAAHITMGTYPRLTRESVAHPNPGPSTLRTQCKGAAGDENRIPLGTTRAGETMCWTLDPKAGTPNPHLLILGGSGSGKTYAVCAVLAELLHRQVPSIVLDFGQGFTRGSAPSEFFESGRVVVTDVARRGIALNPLTIMPSDVQGPVSVAQRIADTFRRVYSHLGIQQHALIRRVVVDAFAAAGIIADSPASWSHELPSFRTIERLLTQHADDPKDPVRRVAASASSHISSLFVFDIFRNGGSSLDWRDMIGNGRGACAIHVLDIHGLEHSLQSVVAEFVLWSFISHNEASGPSSLRCILALDEAHRLSFDRGSPVERLLREGRKFGIGVIVASQQPEDFSDVAYANTATKLVFHFDNARIRLRKVLPRSVQARDEIVDAVGTLPPGHALLLSAHGHELLSIDSFSSRSLVGASRPSRTAND